MGTALCELLERLDDSAAPAVGGTGATVVVTMTLETLQGGLTAAALDTGDRITARTARRLACEAGIIPVVLNGKSEVLDQPRHVVRAACPALTALHSLPRPAMDRAMCGTR